MVKKLEIYRCEVCGNVVEVLTPRDGVLVCCGQDMTLLVGNTVDAAKEKHVPVIEKTARSGVGLTTNEVRFLLKTFY